MRSTPALVTIVLLATFGFGWSGFRNEAHLTTYIDGDYFFDVDDPAEVFARSSDVFVGEVIGIQRSIEIDTTGGGPGIPRTVYAVKVDEVILGNAAGTVSVTQSGGCAPGGGCVYDLGDGRWAPGSQRLFLTQWTAEDGAYAVTVPLTGQILIESPQQRAALVSLYRSLMPRPVTVLTGG